MFERFTDRARQAIALAQEEARALKHNYLGTEHLLLGLLRNDGLAATALSSFGLTLEEARAAVIRVVGTGDGAVSGRIPMTPRTKKVLELALRESLTLGDNYIGTEHILLGIVRENEGVAARVLHDYGADPDSVFEQVDQLLSRPISRDPTGERKRTLRVTRVSDGPEPLLLLTGWLLFAVALGVGILIGWAIWGH